MIKDLLIVIDNSSNADPFLQAAVAFAGRSGARAEVAMLSPGPLAAANLGPFVVLYVPEEVLREEERLATVRASIAGAAFYARWCVDRMVKDAGRGSALPRDGTRGE